MEALGGGGFLHWNFSQQRAKPFKSQRRKSKSSDSAEATGGAGYSFPLKQAATAGSLALTGDTIAQLIQRWRKHKDSEQRSLTRSEDSDKVGLIYFFSAFEVFFLLSKLFLDNLKSFRDNRPTHIIL